MRPFRSIQFQHNSPHHPSSAPSQRPVSTTPLVVKMANYRHCSWHREALRFSRWGKLGVDSLDEGRRRTKKFIRVWCNPSFFLNAQFAKSFATGFTRKSIVMQLVLWNNILSDWSNLIRGNVVVKRPATLYSYPIGLEVKSNRLLYKLQIARPHENGFGELG